MIKSSAFVSLAIVFGAAGAAQAQDSFGGAKPSSEQSQQTGQQQNQQQTQQGFRTGSQQKSTQTGAASDPLTEKERQDFGVAATSQLHAGAMHGPTPTAIPGGQVITTRGVLDLMQNQQTRYVLFDILGGAEIIPGAVAAVPASQPGSFNDGAQYEFAAFLQQMTGGDKQTPLIFYCLSTQCWMSYNASLRAINAGYSNVLWYRGGLEAWKEAGMQTEQVSMGQPF